MPPSLFFEVVLPLLEVDRTSMLAISTPSPEVRASVCVNPRFQRKTSP